MSTRLLLEFPINRQGYPSKIDIFSNNHLQAMGKIVNPFFKVVNFMNIQICCFVPTCIARLSKIQSFRRIIYVKYKYSHVVLKWFIQIFNFITSQIQRNTLSNDRNTELSHIQQFMSIHFFLWKVTILFFLPFCQIFSFRWLVSFV